MQNADGTTAKGSTTRRVGAERRRQNRFAISPRPLAANGDDPLPQGRNIKNRKIGSALVEAGHGNGPVGDSRCIVCGAIQGIDHPVARGVRHLPVALLAQHTLAGIQTGQATNSALCLMLDLTLPQAAGAFVGVWGLAQALSRAIGKLLGGGLLDLGRQLPLGPGPFPAFALVLSVEALVTFGALLLLASLNVHQFRQDTASSLERVLSMEMG